MIKDFEGIGKPGSLRLKANMLAFIAASPVGLACSKLCASPEAKADGRLCALRFGPDHTQAPLEAHSAPAHSASEAAAAYHLGVETEKAD